LGGDDLIRELVRRRHPDAGEIDRLGHPVATPLASCARPRRAFADPL
jgi:hypothetical protein